MNCQTSANPKKSKFGPGVRSLIYSYCNFNQLSNKISKLSSFEREMLVTRYSNVLSQRKKIKFSNKFFKFLKDELKEDSMPTFCKQLQYTLRLSDGVIIQSSFTRWVDVKDQDRIKIQLILQQIFKNAVKYGKNLKLSSTIQVNELNFILQTAVKY